MTEYAEPSCAPTILLVESDVLVRLAVAAYLRECGFKVVEASSASEAMEVLRSTTQIEVVFIDLDAPDDGEGFGVARWIRQNRPSLKVVLSSGATRTAREVGHLCTEGPIISKPYDHKILERHIRELLAKDR